MDLYPGQFMKEEGDSYSAINQNNLNTYNGRSEKYIRYQSVMGDSCLINTDYISENIDFFYVEGCGGPYYTYIFSADQNGHKLLYFKKGSEEWGTRLARDCEDLLSSTDEHFSNQITPLVFPNPFSGNFCKYLTGFFDTKNRFCKENRINVSVFRATDKLSCQTPKFDSISKIFVSHFVKNLRLKWKNFWHLLSPTRIARRV